TGSEIADPRSARWGRFEFHGLVERDRPRRLQVISSSDHKPSGRNPVDVAAAPRQTARGFFQPLRTNRTGTTSAHYVDGEELFGEISTDRAWRWCDFRRCASKSVALAGLCSNVFSPQEALCSVFDGQAPSSR